MTKKNTWKKDKLGRNLLVSKNKDNKTIYKSLSLEKFFKDGLVKVKKDYFCHSTLNSLPLVSLIDIVCFSEPQI